MEVLCGEPFLYRPWEVGRLTDWQAWDVILRPAARRGRDPERGGVRGKADRLPTRDEYIEVGLKLGGDRGRLGAEYDRWAASAEGGQWPD